MSTPTTTIGARGDLREALATFHGLLLRDLRVVLRSRTQFVLRTVSQPLLLVFVFTYVFPRIGQGLRGFDGQASFTDILVPGVVALAVFVKGLQAVALPLVQEFGYTNEIEDRVMAPLPVRAVALAKIVSGAAQAVVGAVIVLPIALVVPTEAPSLQPSPLHLLAVLLLASFLASALGLVLGTFVRPDQVPMMFSVVILPFTFLGATYYPWAQLDAIPWLQWLTLANPLVYLAEGFRMALTPQFPHMPTVAIYAALVGFGALTAAVAMRGFARRVTG